VTHPSGIPVFQRFSRRSQAFKIDKDDVRRFGIRRSRSMESAIDGELGQVDTGRDVIRGAGPSTPRAFRNGMREFGHVEEGEEIREC